MNDEIKEANDSITWWSNRFKAVERDNRELKQENERIEKEWKSKLDDVSMLTSRISKAIEYINNTIEDKPLTDFDCGSNNACNDLLNILQNGSDDNE